MIETKCLQPLIPSEAEPEAEFVSHRPTAASDEALLRRHAPILRLDRRELFLPTSVDAYVRSCELVCRDGRRIPGPDLHELDERWSAGTYLRFVSPEDRRSLTGAQRRTGGRRDHAPRLGRVGVFGRLVDALFLLSVWIRATTPRLTTAAAAAKAERCDLQRSPTCYARSAQAGEWTILHYAYFYVMNDWRSGFRGLNDHEGDWEQIWVFCDPETCQPVWVSATSHDHDGADRRRHWNDPELELADERPVLYVAAGSHALYFRPGDYVTRIDVPGFRGLFLARDVVRRMLRIRGDAAERGVGPAVGVPFIDAASGDGLTIESIEIRPMENQNWLENYRGLWGLDTGDPLQGERGPGGPKFDRQGEIRKSWADPLGCAGLHGTPPPSAVARQVNIDNLDRALLLLDQQIRERGRYLPLASQTNSANGLAEESHRLTELLRQRCELEGLRTRLLQGRWRTDGVRDHLRRPALPLAPTEEACCSARGRP